MHKSVKESTNWMQRPLEGGSSAKKVAKSQIKCNLRPIEEGGTAQT